MDFRDRFIVKPGSEVNLAKIDPNDVCGINDKHEMLKETAENLEKVTRLQGELYAENRQSVLVVLQAMDAGGKDGVINHVFAPLNPQGCRVQSFKVPSELERSHDFLWRVHAAAPRNGEIVIFNRSHYEDVLVVRVHNLVPEAVWRGRYALINDFERLLVSNRTKILKFFLHIGKEEQLERFKERLDNPEKNWKITESDYSERESWDAYQTAFSETLSRCSTERAPWYVIPANNKRFRDLAISSILRHSMEEMSIEMPKHAADLDEIRKLIRREEKK